MPESLHTLAIASLIVAAVGAVVIAFDEVRHPQKMWIMNLVWPLTALFGSLAWTWAYFRFGRLGTKEAAQEAERAGQESPNKRKAFLWKVGEGSSHCGAGCTLGDIVAEWLAFGFPAVATWFGWHWLFQEKTFSVWILDYLFAFGLGVLFQYFTIVPMRGLGFSEGLVAALKADVLSLTAWQIGMYGFMAFASFFLFRHLLGIKLEVNTPEFWFMMQIAMLFGFATSYPVNWWLLKSGIKEEM